RLRFVDLHARGATAKAAALVAIEQPAVFSVSRAVVALGTWLIKKCQDFFRLPSSLSRPAAGESRSRGGQRLRLRRSGREAGSGIRQVSPSSLPGFEIKVHKILSLINVTISLYINATISSIKKSADPRPLRDLWASSMFSVA